MWECGNPQVLKANYDVVMSSPRSIRFEDDTISRLAAYAARRPGATSASAAARLVEEGLRMDAHPGIVFRDGAAGRRAVVIGGPDVWEVVRAVNQTRGSQPKLKGDAVIEAVSANTGLRRALVETALTYYSAFPAEVDERLEQESVLERELAQSLELRTALLGA